MERLLHGSGLTVPILWKPYFNICFYSLPWWCLISSFLLHTQWFENVLHHKIWCIAFCFVHITSVEYTSSHVFLWGVCMCAHGCLKSTSEVIPQKLYLLERISQWDLRFPESVRVAGHGPMLGLWVSPSHLVCFLYVHIQTHQASRPSRHNKLHPWELCVSFLCEPMAALPPFIIIFTL